MEDDGEQTRRSISLQMRPNRHEFGAKETEEEEEAVEAMEEEEEAPRGPH